MRPTRQCSRIWPEPPRVRQQQRRQREDALKKTSIDRRIGRVLERQLGSLGKPAAEHSRGSGPGGGTMRLGSTACLLSALLAAIPGPTLAGDRIFELRTYTAAPGKLDALNARFRDHTIALFKKHGMEVVGFWEPVDKDAGAGEKLVYILAHPSRAAAEANWKAFREDPEWVKVKADSETAGTLAAKVESVFMAATDYSPMK